MILHLTEKDRSMLVFALSIVADEYNTIADQAISRILSKQFRDGSVEAVELSQRISNLVEAPSDEVMRMEIVRLLNAKMKIHAIKYVRTHRPLGLKEAKDLVDRIQDQEERRGLVESYRDYMDDEGN
jgi:ribosomal protein L7/L12